MTKQEEQATLPRETHDFYGAPKVEIATAMPVNGSAHN